MAITAVGDTFALAASGTSNVQPASGEIWLIKAWGAETPDDADKIELYDGTDNATCLTAGASTARLGSNGQSGDAGIVLTNSQYARLVKGANAGDMGYRGVKL